MIVGANGAVVSVYVTVVVGLTLPAASVAFAVIFPLVCGVIEVTGPYFPCASAIAVPVLPSGNVTVTVLPGSAVPLTEIVPFAFTVIGNVIVGANGAVVSVYVTVAVGLTFPATVAAAVIFPLVCGVTEVTGPYFPCESTSKVPVVPSGNVTVTLLPGSAVPLTEIVPFALTVIGNVIVGIAGQTFIVTTTPVAEALP